MLFGGGVECCFAQIDISDQQKFGFGGDSEPLELTNTKENPLPFILSVPLATSTRISGDSHP